MRTKEKLLTVRTVLVMLLILLVAIVWAIGKNKLAVRKDTDKEIWTKIDKDPWIELNNLIANRYRSIPFAQNGEVFLRNTKDSIIESKTFQTVLFDTITMSYRIANMEMFQTAKWQVFIDHEQNILAINGMSKQSFNPLNNGIDIKELKHTFLQNHYNWQVLENGKGDRLLSSADFSSGNFLGLQIRYDESGYALKSMSLGMPKIVSDEESQNSETNHDPGIKLESESIEINYETAYPYVKNDSTPNPNTCFMVKNKKLHLLNKQFIGYRVINNIH